MTTEALELRQDQPLSAVQIRAQVNLIQEVMRAVMKEGTHFGTIPGTGKPTLYKAGAEKILSTFRIAIEPDVLDLSTVDEARYRVIARAISQATGVSLGSGVGECSSSEEKYRWRAAVCEQEYDEAAEDRRRNVWKKSRDGAYQVKQVRTNHADVANTVLKMAKKRAQIDACLTVTAASDVFAQDIEDLPEEIRAAVAEETGEARPPLQPPQRRTEPTKAHPDGNGERKISEAQAKRLFAIAKGAGWQNDELRTFLKAEYGVENSRELLLKDYEGAIKKIQEGSGA